MKPLLKAFLVFALLGTTVNKLRAQDKTLPNSFVILNNARPDQAEFFRNSIAAADMEQYRLRDKRVHLEFENGFEVELYSAKELFVQGATINITNYPLGTGNGQVPVFTVLPNGLLAAKVFNESKNNQSAK